MKCLSIAFLLLAISACGTDGPDPENPCNARLALTGEECREKAVPEESPGVPDCTEKGWCNPSAPASEGCEWSKDESGEWILTKKYTEEAATERISRTTSRIEPALIFKCSITMRVSS